MSENHNLISEFPEFKEALHELKIRDAHFRKLFERYSEIDRAITRSEQRIDLMSEIEEEKIRKERLRLKEEIYLMLKNEMSR